MRRVLWSKGARMSRWLVLGLKMRVGKRLVGRRSGRSGRRKGISRTDTLRLLIVLLKMYGKALLCQSWSRPGHALRPIMYWDKSLDGSFEKTCKGSAQTV